MAFPCPRCGDRYTQRLPLVHASGVWQGTWSNGLRGGTRTSQNALSMLASPPKRKPVILLASAVLFMALYLAVTLAAFVAPHRLHAAAISALASSAQPARTPAAVLPHHGRHHAHTPPLAPIPQFTASAVTNRQAHAPEWATDWKSAAAFEVVPLALLSMMLALLTSRLRYNHRKWPEALRHWQACFLCRGCGCIFLPEAVAELAD